MPSKPKTSRNIPFRNEQTNTTVFFDKFAHHRHFSFKRSLLRCLTSWLLYFIFTARDLYCVVWHHAFPYHCIYSPLEGLSIFLFKNPLHLKQFSCTIGINWHRLKSQPWQCETMGRIQWRVGCNSEGGVLLFLGQWGLMSEIPGTPAQLFNCFAHSRTMLFLAALLSVWWWGTNSNTAFILFQ